MRVDVKALVRKHQLAEAEAVPSEIYIMRHGQTALDSISRSDGWLDFPLTDKGRNGLIRAQQYLKKIPLTVIYAPSLKRTKETAEIIQSGVFSGPVIKSADIARTWNLGELMGTKKAPNKPIVQHYMEHPNDAPVGGESLAQFRSRFFPWLEERQREAMEGAGPVLMVLSGSNLRELGFQLYGNREVLDLDEGGLLCLQNVGGKWTGQVIFGHKNEDDEWLS